MNIGDLLFALEIACLVCAPVAFVIEDIEFGSVLFASGLLSAVIRNVIKIIMSGLGINAVVELALVLLFLIGMIAFWIWAYRDFFS